MGRPNVHQQPVVRRIYATISGMFHYKEQMQVPVEAQESGNQHYADAANEAREAALACHFDCALEQLIDESAIASRALLTDDEALDYLMCSFNISEEARDVVADKIRVFLGEVARAEEHQKMLGELVEELLARD